MIFQCVVAFNFEVVEMLAEPAARVSDKLATFV